MSSHIDMGQIEADRGIRAVKISLVGLLVTFFLQIVVAWIGGSAALVADALHNLADAFASVPLWAAFLLSKRGATRRFPYGYTKAEDLAGVVIVLVILGSAFLAAYESLRKWLHQAAPTHLGLGMAAALIGLIGNELVAIYKIREGKAIGSAALVADGLHSQVDGLTSLAAFLGLLGVSLGFPWADPAMGLLISFAIFYLVWEAGRDVVLHLMDAIEPGVLERIERTAEGVEGVRGAHQIRARWSGRHVYVCLCIQVDPALTVVEGHRIAEEVRHVLLHRIPQLADVDVHVDPAWEGSDPYHTLTRHHFEGGVTGPLQTGD